MSKYSNFSIIFKVILFFTVQEIILIKFYIYLNFKNNFKILYIIIYKIFIILYNKKIYTYKKLIIFIKIYYIFKYF